MALNTERERNISNPNYLRKRRSLGVGRGYARLPSNQVNGETENRNSHVQQFYSFLPKLQEDASIKSAGTEVLKSTDHRIKPIGEVLANDTARAIFLELHDGLNTAALISRSLKLDLSLVVRHLQKLVRIGMIRIERVSISQKGRPLKVYAPSRVLMILIESKKKLNERYNLSHDPASV